MILAIILISIQVVLFFVDLSLSAVHFTGNTAGAIIDKGADFTASKLGVEVNDRLKETLGKTIKFTFNASIKTVKVIIHIVQFILGMGVFCALLIAFFLSIMLTMAPAVLGGGALITIIAQSKDYAELAQDLGIANILEDPNYEGVVEDVLSGETTESASSEEVTEDGKTSTAAAPNVPVSNAGLSGKLETLAKWYENHCYPHYGTWTTSCELIPFRDAVRADCSGFACAYMSYVSGKNVADTDTSTLATSNWGSGSGWVKHNVSEFSSIDQIPNGSIAVDRYPDSSKKSGYVHHAECFVDKNHKFGWGDKRAPGYYPHPWNWSLNNGMLMDYSCHYRYIYIYEGGN